MPQPLSPQFRTPLSRARGLGSAKHGVGEFIAQRVSAMAMVLLVLWGVWSALRLAGAGYEGAVLWLRSPLNAALLVLLLGVGFFHARIGVKVIVEDYVHQPLLKTATLVLNLFVCVAAFAVSALAALKVALSVSGGV